MFYRITPKHNMYKISLESLKVLATRMYRCIAERNVILDTDELMDFVSCIFFNSTWETVSQKLPIYVCLPNPDTLIRMRSWLLDCDSTFTEMDCFDVLDEITHDLDARFTYLVDLDKLKSNPYPAYRYKNKNKESNVGCIIINPQEKFISVSDSYSKTAPSTLNEFEYDIRISGVIHGNDLYQIMTNPDFADCIDGMCNNWRSDIDNGVLKGHLPDEYYERLRQLEKKYFNHESANKS